MSPSDRPPHTSSEHPRSTEGERPSAGSGRAIGYRRFLGLSAVGALFPGAGLIAAGRRRLGWVLLGAFLIGAGAAAVYLYRAGNTGLVKLGTDTDRVNAIGYGLIVVAAGWLVIAAASLRALEPKGLSGPRRLLAALMVTIVTSTVLIPLGIGSHYAFTQRDFIESVFPDEEQNQAQEQEHDGEVQHPGGSDAAPAGEEQTDDDPWADRGRVNVLLLGSDAGADRDGVRTDTIMVASIDTQSGDTALFSLPRNLQYAPFPEGELRDAYPNGFHGAPASEYWLSSVYRHVPDQFPDYFSDYDDPGAAAVKLVVGETLGLEIDYYAMVNLDGFQAIVDALGGVVIDVPYDIPMGTQATNWGTCTQPRDWIRAGEQQRLDGDQALWFARARCGPAPINDDYERMRRQRCMIGAITAQVNPSTLLMRYLNLERAVRDNFTTDIPRQRLDDFAELGERIQEAEIRSLPFTDELVDYTNPDYELIRDFVQESLEPSGEPSSDSTHEAVTHGEDDDGHGDGAPGSTGDEPDESDGAQSIDVVC
ncbi:LCP family protein [Phytoactinopolyspora halotolerans]|uniref:LCP family protein n=1 Tax=Phytoactinopolyspora halotolerans TaxID=1981512 RepID=A0A6L9S337_9ACTN|nr:LCP family protein [Phytoactinopolyspora halotolerans]NED98971.1 LCP family protein [Phytoactinopolyspora halotolerans]